MRNVVLGLATVSLLLAGSFATSANPTTHSTPHCSAVPGGCAGK